MRLRWSAIVTVGVAGVVVILNFAILGQQPVQNEPASSEMTVPRLVAFNGVIRSQTGNLSSGVTGVRFSLYKEQEGGVPLWSESQNVQLDEQGHYSVLLGAYSGGGLPMELFTSGESRWLGITVGEEEQPRVLLVSVPYALKAADADTLGGKPASAFLLSQPDGDKAESAESAASEDEPTPADVSGTGTAGNLVKWLDGAGALGDSVVAEAAGKIGIGTPTPAAPLEVVGVAEALRLTTPGNTELRMDSTSGLAKSRSWVNDSAGNFFLFNRTDNTAEFTIDTNHRLGIGLGNPGALVHVFSPGDGFVQLEGTSPVTNVGWLIRNNAPSGRQWSVRSTGSGQMVFRDDTAGAERLVMDASGTVTGSNFAGNGSGLTNVDASSLDGVAAAAYRTRGITYLAGCDTCSLLTDADDQKTIYANMIGQMTINSVTCFSDAGTPSINLQRDDGTPANVLSSNLLCSTTGETSTSFSGSENVLNLNDKLDFVLATAGGTAKRATVVIKATIN